MCVVKLELVHVPNQSWSIRIDWILDVSYVSTYAFARSVRSNHDASPCLHRYGEAFETAAVSGPLLLTLTDADLKDELGVASSLHRRKVRTMVALPCPLPLCA